MKNIAAENLITVTYDKPQMTKEQLAIIGRIHGMKAFLLEKEYWALLDNLEAVEKYIRNN